VTELMERNLRSLINSRRSIPGRNFPFDLPVSIDIVLQIAEALVHVHECGVIYRDLKAENCLVNGKGDGYVVKLTDFGESKLRCSEMGSHFKTRNKGSRAWMAPEVMGNEKDEQNYTWSADVYSFGMTCYEVFTGEKPFGDITLIDLKRRVCAGHRPEIPDDCPRDLAKLMRKCWAHNPSDRPTFKDIQKGLWDFKLHCTIWNLEWSLL
jgi:serine/threonine protein kinase